MVEFEFGLVDDLNENAFVDTCIKEQVRKLTKGVASIKFFDS